MMRHSSLESWLFRFLEIEKSFAEKNKNLNAQVFISVCSKEGESMVPKVPALVDPVKAHNYSGLILTSQIFEDERNVSCAGTMT